jgi:hypothetical protein
MGEEPAGNLADRLRRWRVSRASGRNAKFPYYAGRVAEELLVPAWVRRAQREGLLRRAETHPMRAEIAARAAYACKAEAGGGEEDWGAVGRTPAGMRVGEWAAVWPRRKHTYFFDARQWLRYFDPGLRFRMVPGDMTWVPERPALVKARPVGGDNANSVLMKLNRIRHFTFVDDPLGWTDKDSTAVFRGKIFVKPKREKLFEAWFGKKGFDLGDTSGERPHPEWVKPQMSIHEQLRHRYVLSVEGNDVATNVKWLFHSNSLAVMPRPRYETWFEEGRLGADVHYVEVRDDFADLEEKIAYCEAHPEFCEAINRAEHAWAARFLDPEVERLVALEVLARYFRATGQA